MIGINKDTEAGQEAADNLRAHFNEEINNGQDDGGFDIVDYNAMDDDDVARLFDKLLDRLTELPEMDRQKIEYCMSKQDVVGRIAHMADDVVASMDRVPVYLTFYNRRAFRLRRQAWRGCRCG